MAKTKEQLLAKGKARRQKNLQASKDLKLRKNWYPVTDAKNHFKRACKRPHNSHIHKDLTPGQIVILLAGRFRGRRVVYLKKLESGLLLVTGPYKINGVPLKRVNAAYILPTNTKLQVDAKVADKIKDEFFKNKVDIKREKDKDFFEKDFVEEPSVKKARVSADRSNAQNEIDVVVKKAVDAVPEMKGYLKNRFALKSGDKPHLMKF
ncbi:MAG: 60S ribosomal protein L6 [archaeon]|nr:60S ribosomal protein L6 [archaeon]